MRDVLLIACLLALALVPSKATAASTSTLLTAQLDPPVAGVRICWQTRCYETDTAGRWAHSVTVASATNYELVVTDGAVTVTGVKGAAGMTVTWISDSRVRFRFASTPGASSGPITIYVQAVDATPTATFVPPATVGPTVTPSGPTPTAEPTGTPDLWGDAMRADVRCAIEAALLEAVQVQACQRPPLDPIELAASELYAVAHMYAPGTPGSNWLVAPGIPLTGEVTIATPIGDAQAMALADVYVVRIGPRVWVCQWGACVFAGVRPGMMLEVVE